MVFYGDRTTADMNITTLLPFNDGIPTFVPGKRATLDKAVKEALFETHLNPAKEN